MKQEEWKTISTFKKYDFENKYEVSTWGRVRNSRTKKELKHFTKAEGSLYQKVAMYDKNIKRINIYIHQLVALSFIGPQPKDSEIDHIDGNAANNSISNLRYVTHKENMQAFYECIAKNEAKESA
jgi:hypothetical protein